MPDMSSPGIGIAGLVAGDYPPMSQIILARALAGSPTASRVACRRGLDGFELVRPAPLVGSVVAPMAPGLYRIHGMATGYILYIGESRNLVARLGSHAQRSWGEAASYSYVTLGREIPRHNLRELENDLIGAYYHTTGRAPALQFGQINPVSGGSRE